MSAQASPWPVEKIEILAGCCERFIHFKILKLIRGPIQAVRSAKSSLKCANEIAIRRCSGYKTAAFAALKRTEFGFEKVLLHGRFSAADVGRISANI